ncbi:MAG: sugar phosphate nucleotidyltransferase [Pseudobdellovibrio sp.]
MRSMLSHQLDSPRVDYNKPYLLVTMAGRGQRYKDAGYKEPKPFVPVLGKPIIQRLLDLFPIDWPSVFVFNNVDYEKKHLDQVREFRKAHQFENSHVQLTSIDVNTSGPMKTVMAGVELVADQAPVMVTYCDYGMVWNPQEFLDFTKHNDSDIIFISYKGFHAHYLSSNMYCYTKTDGIRVLDIKEKESFSPNREDDYASTGAYFFKSAALLKQALAEQKLQGLNWHGEYFTSLAIKALMNVRQDLKIHVYEINKFFQWGTPEDLKAFEYWAEVDYANFKK